ncbi:MAG TPA: hypothetical protein PKE55_04805 [Kiritimatiellia bacterium]|nr:hypothetical protein [Kiritimatiellia bacterium]
MLLRPSILLPLLLLALRLPLSASAWQADVYQGYWGPRNFDDGYGFGLAIGHETRAGAMTSLRLAIYPQFDRTVATSTEPVDLELQVLPLELTYMIPLVPPGYVFRSYLGGGIGYFFTSLKSKGPAGEITTSVDDHFGWLAGGGLNLHVTDSFALFGEMFFRGIAGRFRDGSLTSPTFTRELDFSGLSFQFGMRLSW